MLRSRVRPLVKVDSDGAVYRSADGRWTFMRHESDPRPKRWFAYLDGDEFPSNSGEGHTTLREVGQWAERYPLPPKPDAASDDD